MKRRTKKKKSIILRLMILIVCAYFTVSLAGLWNELNDKLAEHSKYTEQKIALEEDIEELRSLLNSEDKEIIEQALRRQGYAYPDEQKFIDISGN